MKQLNPIVYSQVERVSGTLPKAALSAEAKKWTVKAIQSYDPTKGAALATHVLNFLPKIRRLNYKYQNSVRMPENLHLEHSTFTAAQANLNEKLGREPTDEEMAKELGWGRPLVTRFKASLYDDLVESVSQRPTEVSQFNENAHLMAHLMGSLTDQEKFILGDANDMPAKDAAAKLNINLSRYNYLRSKLKEKIQGIKNEIKMY
jgi:DNA-directed RNA polymerase specialized sigma subunit